MELEALGVDLGAVRARLDDNGKPMIGFEWGYPGRPQQTYSITFIGGDLQYPKTYLPFLPKTIDIYYQNAGNYMADLYRHPLCYIHYI